jgi:hypothetical protein
MRTKVIIKLYITFIQEFEDDFEDIEGYSDDLYPVNKIVDPREAINDDRKKNRNCPTSPQDVPVDFSNFTDWALSGSEEPTNAISDGDQQLLGVLSDFEGHAHASFEKPSLVSGTFLINY